MLFAVRLPLPVCTRDRLNLPMYPIAATLILRTTLVTQVQIGPKGGNARLATIIGIIIVEVIVAPEAVGVGAAVAVEGVRVIVVEVAGQVLTAIIIVARLPMPLSESLNTFRVISLE